MYHSTNDAYDICILSHCCGNRRIFFILLNKHWLRKRWKAVLKFIFNKINTPVIFHLVMIEKSSRFTQNTKLIWVLQSHHSEYDHSNVNTKGEESYPWYLLLMQQRMIEATNVRISNDQVTLQLTMHLVNTLLSCKQWFFCSKMSQSSAIQLLGLKRDSIICFRLVLGTNLTLEKFPCFSWREAIKLIHLLSI